VPEAVRQLQTQTTHRLPATRVVAAEVEEVDTAATAQVDQRLPAVEELRTEAAVAVVESSVEETLPHILAVAAELETVQVAEAEVAVVLVMVALTSATEAVELQDKF